MPTARTRTFRSGNSQAVRLPKGIAFEDGVELTVERKGDVVTLKPAQSPVGEMFRKLAALPPIDHPMEAERLEFPERG